MKLNRTAKGGTASGLPSSPAKRVQGRGEDGDRFVGEKGEVQKGEHSALFSLKEKLSLKAGVLRIDDEGGKKKASGTQRRTHPTLFCPNLQQGSSGCCGSCV